jgi:ankyrin repeat domain-containing protein 50
VSLQEIQCLIKCSSFIFPRFLLASLHIQNILQQTTKRRLLDAIRSIKFDLSLVYMNMLQRINPLGLKLLQWVLYAWRPLTLEELRYAVAIDPAMTDIDPDLDLPPYSFTDSTFGLLSVDNDSKLVRFSHSTVRHYLTHHAELYFPSRHALLAQCTLTYLNFPSLIEHSSNSRFDDGGDLNVFFDYAASNWGHHVYMLLENDPLWMPLLELGRNWLFSEQFRHVSSPFSHPRQPFFTEHSPLHAVCFFGLPSLTVELIDVCGEELNQADGNGKTPLHYAVIACSLAAVKALIQRPNILLNIGDGTTGRTALHHAACAGDEEILRALLQHPDIDVNAHANDGMTALHEAILEEEVELACAILEHPDFQVNTPDFLHSWTPLILAANDGLVEVVGALLVRPDLRVNDADDEGWTALTCAVDEGHEEIVRMLLMHQDIDIVASRVSEPGFWENIPEELKPSRKHMSLPNDLLIQLRLK